MSGICAVWGKGHPQSTAKALHSLCDGLSVASEEVSSQISDFTAGVGVSARFPTQQLYKSDRLLIACDADLVNERDFEATPCTAAILAVAYEKYGPDFVDRLRGNFSLVLWDRLERKMLAAVDGFGVNRLVYYQGDNVLLISSRVDALVNAGVPLDINPRAIPNVLNFGVNLGPGTILARVERLAPGTLLIASEQQTRVHRYWQMRYRLVDDVNEDRLSRELEALVESSVAAHCKEDSFENLGAFLSGGTDSSTVVGMMARQDRGRPKAFSIGFAEQPFNELGYAEIAANAFNARHYTYLVGPEDCFRALPGMVRLFDEPFGNNSAIPTYFCAWLAAQNGVTVLLTGDGGDELYGGNERYATDKIFTTYQHVPAALRKGLIERALAWCPLQGGIFRRARGYVRRANMAPVERVLSFHFLSTHTFGQVFEPDFLDALGGYSILDVPTRYYHEASARDHLDRFLYVDVRITLGDSDLPKVTCMSEMAGVQTRYPFLDRSIAEFSGRLPARLKVKGFEKRYLFKRAFRNLLPTEIIRKKKHGFGIPVAHWLKSYKPLRELARDTLLSSRASERGYFRRSFIEEMFRQHESDSSSYYGDALWTFLALELWHRQVVDQPVKVSA